MRSHRVIVVGTGLVLVLSAGLAMATAGALSGADPSSRGLARIDALLEGGARDGACFSEGRGHLIVPDPAELTRAVKADQGPILRDGGIVGQRDEMLKTVGGRLVSADGDEITVARTRDSIAVVETYQRVETSEGQPVWYWVGSLRQVECEPPGD
jgi:hypothetical protein